MEDKTIDKNKKYPPMENLADAGKKSSARNGLLKLKRIRDEMFKKKHQSLKEEEENKQNQEEATPETTEIKDKTEETDGKFKTIQCNSIYVNLFLFLATANNTDDKKDEINFAEQKKDDKDGATSSHSSSDTTSEASGDSTDSEAAKDKRKQSSSSRKNNEVINDLISQFKSLERPDWQNVSLTKKSGAMVIAYLAAI